MTSKSQQLEKENSELKKENEKLQLININDQFKAVQDLYKFGQMETNLNLGRILDKFEAMSIIQKQIVDNELPHIKKDIQDLKDHKITCPIQNGKVSEIEKKIDEHIKKTKWVVDLSEYKWLVIALLCLSAGKNIWDIVALFLK